MQDTILSDLSTSMKAQEKDKVAVLRMIKAAFLNAEKADGKKALSDEEVTAILSKEVKKRRESEAAFAEGGRDDLVQQEKLEREIIEAYLPEQMTEEEILKIVTTIAERMNGADFGAVMGAAMQELKGKADGNKVKQVVQQVLN